jgi:hypothetical protein
MSAASMRRSKNKLISLFVLAFLCLNAGGVLCLTYCSQGVKARPEHCPLRNARAHCPHSKTPAKTADADQASAIGSVSCCVMPIGMIAPAPLEARTRVEVPVAAAIVVKTTAVERPVLSQSRQIPGYYYRPPPNDRRGDRIRNQVFRI